MDLIPVEIAFVGRSTRTAIVVDVFLELTGEGHLFRRSRGRMNGQVMNVYSPLMNVRFGFDDRRVIYGLWGPPMFRVLVCAKRHPWYRSGGRVVRDF